MADGRTTWSRSRRTWVKQVRADRLLAVIADVASRWNLDENDGDREERADTIVWLASRGKRAREWGHAGEPAQRFGGWKP